MYIITNVERTNNTLVICPSRGRPKECKRMVESFLETSNSSTIKLLLDMDDKTLEEYRDTIKGVSYTIGFRKTTTELINDHWKFSSDCFKYFSVTNDDFIYRTKNWDTKLINSMIPNRGLGIAYGDDLLAGQAIPTTSIISREIVEALGWLQMPTLTHLFGDNVWAYIGKICKCLYYNPSVVIEHMHVFANKQERDDTFERCNSKKMYEIDSHAYGQWLIEQSQEDIKTVSQVLKNAMVTI